VQTITEIRGLSDMDADPPGAPVLRRGDYNSKGKIVGPGVPLVLAPVGFNLQPTPGYKTSGRRKAFAEWLVNPGNPTTSRVQVNRIWAHRFGRGLVETVEDFGHLGNLPSHPELLDWLATEFIALKWSQKDLHRLMLNSTAYRQTSQFDQTKATADPDNVLLWAFRPQRHEGEVVRDTLLSLSGDLNLEMFGPPVPVAAQGDGSFGVADDSAGKRRSIYLKVRRSQPITLLETFDTPKMEVNCARRTEAIVATQALALLNSPFVETSAQRFAKRVVAVSADRDARLNAAYQWLYTRDPSDTERQTLGEFLDEFVRLQLGTAAASATPEQRAAADLAAWSQASLAWINSNEFLWAD